MARIKGNVMDKVLMSVVLFFGMLGSATAREEGAQEEALPLVQEASGAQNASSGGAGEEVVNVPGAEGLAVSEPPAEPTAKPGITSKRKGHHHGKGRHHKRNARPREGAHHSRAAKEPHGEGERHGKGHHGRGAHVEHEEGTPEAVQE